MTHLLLFIRGDAFRYLCADIVFWSAIYAHI